jgi:phosphate-selective porin OprO/OprP
MNWTKKLMTAALFCTTGAWAQDGASTPEMSKERVDKQVKSEVTPGGIMRWTTNDGSFSFWIDGRLYIDFAHYVEDNDQVLDLASGSEIRRVRTSLKAQHWTHWQSELDIEYSENEVEVQDAWMSYSGIPHTLLKVGHFKEPFGMENLTSSRYMDFIERSYADNIPAGRKIGASATGQVSWGQLSAGFFQQSAGEVDTRGNKDADEAWAVTGRASANLLGAMGIEDYVLHLGGSASYRTPNAFSNGFLYEGRTETKVSKIKFLQASIGEAAGRADFGFEAAAQWKRFSFKSEYVTSSVIREDTSRFEDVAFDGGYVMTSVFLTDDQSQYRGEEGEFADVVPKSKWGAVELLGRMSYLDLNEGGTGKNLTAGLNWHANPNHKIMFNYTRVNLDKYANAGGAIKGVNNAKDLDFDQYALRFVALF